LTTSFRKRYLLLAADGELSSADEKQLSRLLEQRHGRFSLIRVRGSGDHFIVKTDWKSAAEMRESFSEVEIGGKRVRSVLTSGCIGKLKKRVRERAASADAKVSQ